METKLALRQRNSGENDSSSGLDTLRSSKQRKVLDIVDKLRTYGLGAEVSLPQLVVCGDQSAGKSSVLEALTEITFPRGDELCTRFATEIILRRSVSDEIVIKIIPDTMRSTDEQQSIKAFNYSITDFSGLTTQLSNLIEKAKVVMGISGESSSGSLRTFARDVLSIEIAGPRRPQLTVVDLPGMIQNENNDGDKALVDELTEKYISQSRTICLAIITAMNDADNQRILSLVKKADPDGDRSMGIVTKPDTLPSGSGSERAFIGLASNANHKYFFKRGWHVLKNRNFKESDATFERRNQIEANFFETSNFKELPKSSVGIESLRQRLSSILFDHIKSEIPGMRAEVEKMLEDTQTKLQALGDDRSTVSQCLDYLMDVSERTQEVGKNALLGNYDGNFFKAGDFVDFDPTSTCAVRRLRALIQKTNEGFAEQISREGHTFHIDHKNEDGEDDDDFASGDQLEVLRTKSNGPIRISYNVALTWARNMILQNRGRELPGNYNPLVIGELYRIQSRHWASIAEEHLDSIADICSNFVHGALRDHCSTDVCENVWIQHVQEALIVRKSRAIGSLEKIVRAFQEYPINYNHYYTDTVQKIRQDRDQARYMKATREGSVVSEQWDTKRGVDVEKFDTAQLSQNPVQKPESDMLRFSCEEVLDCMRAIYKVKHKVFVDVVVTLVVEENLIRGLSDIFSPKVVGRLSDEAIQDLALEPESVSAERSHYQDQIRRLRDGRNLLRSVMSIGEE